MRYRGRKRIRIPWDDVKRIGIYAAFMFLLAVAQCSFFARIEKLPATPDLILAAVTVIAVTDRWESAAISGIVGGIIIDALGGVGIYLSPVLYFAAALVVWTISQKMMTRYLSWLAVFPVACLMRAAFTILLIFLSASAFEFTDALLYIILPEAIVTLVFALPQYPLIRLCTLPFQGRRDLPIR